MNYADNRQMKSFEEIDRKLLEALDDGPAAPWTPQDLEELKSRVRERHPILPEEV